MRRSRRFTVHLIDLLRPGHYWPEQATIEQAFQAFRHMVKTSSEYPGKTDSIFRSRSVVDDLLSGKANCATWGHEQVAPLRSLKDLRERFQYALLYKHGTDQPLVEDWRRKNGFTVNHSLTLEVPYIRPSLKETWWNSDLAKKLNEFFNSNGVRLWPVLNNCHPKACVVQTATIEVYPEGFAFKITYGYKAEDRSTWSNVLARSEEGETFIDTLCRARQTYLAMTLKSKSLVEAVEMGHLGEVKRWLIDGVDPNQPDAQGITPLEVAIHRQTPDILEALVEAGADMTQPPRNEHTRGYSFLHQIVHANIEAPNALRCLRFLAGRLDVNSQDTRGRAPLHYVAENGNLEFVQLLLESGADPNLCDQRGMRPWDIAEGEAIEPLLRAAGERRLLSNFVQPTQEDPCTEESSGLVL